MWALPLVSAALSLSILTGCTAEPENVEGEAGPAGVPSATAGATVSASAVASSTPSATAGATAAAPLSRPARPTTVRTATPRFSPTTARISEIRRTDWANVTLANVGFMGLGELRFRAGRASSGANNCTMLPGGARPVYAEFLTEEPASSPVTEDALILIECGSDGSDQALVPVQLGFDQRTRQAVGFIQADPSTGPGSRMTFISYTVERGMIVTTVQKTDGTRETRRYRSGGGDSWERV